LAAFAEWERENISDRMMRGKEQKAKQGGIVGAPLPYGYRYDDKKNIIVDPSEAAIVKRLFQDYQRKGMFTLAKNLNAEKIPSPSKTRWSMPGIKHILENPFYIGEIHFNRKKDEEEKIKSKGNHEAIIPIDLFRQTQETMSKRVNNAGAPTSNYPFSGVLRCSRCNGAMTGTKFSRTAKSGERKTYYFYHCNSRRIGMCDIPQVSERKLEKVFFSFDFSTIKNDFAAPSDEQVDTESEIEEIKAQLAKVKATKKRWQLAFGEGVIDLDEFRDLSKMTKEQEQKLNEKLDSLLTEKNHRPIYDISDFLQQVAHIKKFWCKMNRDEKHEFISTVVNRIVIDVDEKSDKSSGRDCKILDFQLN
jgi:site-specific DNA recombinase